MFRQPILILVPALLFLGQTLGANEPARRHRARLSFEVRLQDYAGLQKGSLDQATATAGAVFKRAGVIVEWVDCTPTNADIDERCKNRLGKQVRVLRILSPEMTAKIAQTGIEFGRAMLVENGSRGTYASVYWQRVKELAGGRAGILGLGLDIVPMRLKEARILGYVLAHELGHLFGNHHSKVGVMHGPWSPSELAEVLRGTLRFRKTEERHIRLSVTRSVEELAAD